LQGNITLFDDISAKLEGQPIDLICADDHCDFNITGILPETTLKLNLLFKSVEGVSRKDFSKITLEYWPNDQLDPYGV